jgi:23S rRNA (pseudouridine1915-N3)-methyltransferase
LNIELLAAGTKPPAWTDAGFREYQKRLPREWRLLLKEVPVARRSKGKNLDQLKREEGDKMLAAIKPGAMVVTLDREGDIWTTEQLAARFEKWMQSYSDVQLLIGGPDGLDARCIERSNVSWSLSRLTFPHFLVRTLVAEQLYRAWSIMANHPYHK